MNGNIAKEPARKIEIALRALLGRLATVATPTSQYIFYIVVLGYVIVIAALPRPSAARSWTRLKTAIVMSSRIDGEGVLDSTIAFVQVTDPIKL